MKKLLISLHLLLLITVSYSQNKITAKADRLFESYQYVNAINEYLKIAESKSANEYVFEQLADSYFTIFDMENASKWYAKAIKGAAKPESYFRYAQTLKSFGNYKEADNQMAIFVKLMPNDSRAKEYKANSNYLPKLENNSKLLKEFIYKYVAREYVDTLLHNLINLKWNKDNANSILFYCSTKPLTNHEKFLLNPFKFNIPWGQENSEFLGEMLNYCGKESSDWGTAVYYYKLDVNYNAEWYLNQPKPFRHDVQLFQYNFVPELEDKCINHGEQMRFAAIKIMPTLKFTQSIKLMKGVYENGEWTFVEVKKEEKGCIIF
jgi:tetratricopeptide (TPR) repeat protein